MSGVWGSKCIAQLPTPLPGIVDGLGNPMETFETNNTWGIDVKTCERYCNHNIIPLTFQFQSFSNAFTNFLLPWLGLVAQLPYETGGPLSSVMSASLALGSPALAAYSLTLTILNRRWVRKRLQTLIKRAKDSDISEKYPRFADRVRNIQCLLLESQQIPIRASQKDGWLSSLLVSYRNQKWWERLRISLKKTRRETTPSFVFQIATAITAWILTIIASFVGTLGDISTSLQVSGGALWLWMIPILIGWICVGTQIKFDAIETSMEREGSYRALAPPVEDDQYAEELPQEGIISSSCLSPQPKKIQTVPGVFETSPLEHLEIPTILLLGIAGDELQPGPIFNYARVFTWWQFTDTIEKALRNIAKNVSLGKACKQDRQSNNSGSSSHCDWDEDASVERNLEGNRLETANYCGIGTQKVLAYPQFSDIPTDIINNMILAAVVAMWIQWGTTGPSIIIAYLTPTVGLGCRSGSYLIYGLASTLVWICMVASMLLSHAAMLIYQTKHCEDPSIDLRKSKKKRETKHAIIAGTAVILRVLGRLVAGVNALWLLIASLMEMVGGFDNCWCKGIKATLGDKGWVVLFKTADELAQASRLPMGAGVGLSIVVCSIGIILFRFCSLEKEDE